MWTALCGGAIAPRARGLSAPHAPQPGSDDGGGSGVVAEVRVSEGALAGGAVGGDVCEKLVQ